jgi:uncharacterized Zn finger protein
MGKGTLIIEIKCANCGSTVLQFPDDLADSSLVHCTGCGHNVGPYGAIKAALRGETHTPVGVVTTEVFKPLD